MKNRTWHITDHTNPRIGQVCEITHPSFAGTRTAEWNGFHWILKDCSHPLQNGSVLASHSAWSEIVDSNEERQMHDMNFYYSLWKACHDSGCDLPRVGNDPRLSDLAKILAPNGVRFVFKPQ